MGGRPRRSSPMSTKKERRTSSVPADLPARDPAPRIDDAKLAVPRSVTDRAAFDGRANELAADGRRQGTFRWIDGDGDLTLQVYDESGRPNGSYACYDPKEGWLSWSGAYT